MNREYIYRLIDLERDFQDIRWGSLEEKNQSVAGFITILESKLSDAKRAWMKNIPGPDSSLSEIIKIAAVAVACIEQHGSEGN